MAARRRVAATVIAVGALVPATCNSIERASYATYGDCESLHPSRGRHVDWGHPAEGLAVPGAWIRIRSVEAADLDTRTGSARSQNAEGFVDGSFEVVGGEHAATYGGVGAQIDALIMPTQLAHEIILAQQQGAHIYGLVGDQRSAEPSRRLAFTVAFFDDGFAMLGPCALRKTTWLKGMYGEHRPNEEIREWIGWSQRQLQTEVDGLLFGERRPRPAWQQLHEHLDIVVAGELRRVRWRLDPLPDPWSREGFVLCPSIDRRWGEASQMHGECIDLGEPLPEVPLMMWFDPEQRWFALSVVERDPWGPRATLGVIDLRPYLRTAEQGTVPLVTVQIGSQAPGPSAEHHIYPPDAIDFEVEPYRAPRRP